MNDTPSIQTRRAAQDDLPEICRLWRHMMEAHQQLHRDGFALDRAADNEFLTYLQDILENYLHAVFVATKDERVAGYAIVAEMENPSVFALKRYGFICEICVDPALQGGGVGHALFERARRWFERRGLKVVQLNVAPGNQAAKRFYENLGFQPFLETLWVDLKPPRK